jgi:hypothetical protein
MFIVRTIYDQYTTTTHHSHPTSAAETARGREERREKNNKTTKASGKRKVEGKKKVVPTHVSPPDARTNVLRLQYVYRPHPNKKSSDDE